MEETTLLKLDKVDICREENVILHRASFTLHNGGIRVCDRKSRFWQEQPVEILVLRNSHQSRGRMVVGL